jgi:nucleotide-binding universal stress UspA family protein
MVDGVGPLIVGTDFSEGSAAALAEGRRLAARLGVAVEVIHVVDGVQRPGWRPGGEADAWLRAAGLSPEDLRIRFGSPWVEMARLTDDRAALLLVVGSHGLSGYQPLAVGSTASRLSMAARCPVVLVSPQVRPRESVLGSGEVAAPAGVAGARSEPGDHQRLRETR